MSTPMHTSALLAELAAEGHTLRRCRGGFRNPATPLHIHNRRTINALVAGGEATYDCPIVPSRVTLTTSGVARAQLLAQAVEGSAA